MSGFDAWLDRFFADYYERRPVNATFVGVHDHDDSLPDYSPAGVEASLAGIRDLQDDLAAHPPGDLDERQRLDRELAAGALAIQRWELEGDHVHRSNPSLYVGEAVFGVFSLFLTDFAPLDERVADAVSRMRAVPEFLAQARETLDAVPEHWVWRAKAECGAARQFFGSDAELLVEQAGVDHPEFLDAAAAARDAVEDFEAHLDAVEYTDDHAAGEDALELVVKRGHFRDESLDEVVALGEQHLDRANRNLREGLAAFDAETPEEALAALREDHPSAEEYYDRHAELYRECRELVDGEILTWPDYPLEFCPRPEWAREAARDLYFLFYRAPAPGDDVEPVEYLLEPVEPEMDESTRRERLERWHTAEMKLNHVVHHGGPGHHVQNYRAYEDADSRVGRMAAVDTASRIALCCGGTMAEGWATYVTDLVADTDFLTPRERYSTHQTRRRMAARAVVDVQLHRGAFSAAEAMAFYREEAGFGEWGARYEVVKNSMFPGMALMYLLGNRTVHDLRADFEDSLGEAFDPVAFHDEFLSYGSVPVSLVAARMRATHDT